MKVCLFHNAVDAEGSAADRDVLAQVAAVEAACQALGHSTSRVPCTLNLEAAEQAFSAERPDVVFNLVESLAESDRLAHLAAALLEALDLPYTGATAAALQLTNNKPLTKERLRAAGLPTPDWVSLADCHIRSLAPPYIIKAIWEHASVGIDDHAVIATGDGSTLPGQLESRSRQLGGECFAEQFIAGREFNLSLLTSPAGGELLPPAEIDFSAFPEDKPKIVGYAAKWDERSFEFGNTPRMFDFNEGDVPLLEELKTLALKSWQLLDLRGYARVDFRVDAEGQPFILEINANPCLSPDAGFAAALAEGKIGFEQAIERILAEAVTTWDKPFLRALHGLMLPGRKAALHVPLSAAPVAPAVVAPAEPDAPAADSAKVAGIRKANVKLRTEVKASDAAAVRKIVEATGLFRPGELDVAVELVQIRLDKGEASGYEFVFAQLARRPVGYACFGRNQLTVSSFDLYWIAVEPSKQGQGIGRLLLDEVERQVAAAGGTRIYIETSHRPDYQPTRGFYERCGYQLVTVLEDYYAPGDGRAIYMKKLTAPV
jgi:D-alanine-D-alanine ligase-like ATP-grasp enzyme/ribosomal protein S18 acetylase RimI-like enzyme